MTDEIEPISAEQARAILNAAIRERLGADWDADEEGWVMVSGHDYMARLTRGRVTIDFYVDLLGSVTVQEKKQGFLEDNGRVYAWLFLLLSLVIAFIIARIAGLI